MGNTIITQGSIIVINGIRLGHYVGSSLNPNKTLTIRTIRSEKENISFTKKRKYKIVLVDSIGNKDVYKGVFLIKVPFNRPDTVVFDDYLFKLI
jgi:hypothetical protein